MVNGTIVKISLPYQDRTRDTKSSPYWTGKELLELFDMHGLGESAYKSFFAASAAAMNDLNSAKEKVRATKESLEPVISSNTKMVLEHLVFSMRMITSPKFSGDYRACITENVVRDYKSVVSMEIISVRFSSPELF